MSIPVLRPYQVDTIEETRRKIASGKRSIAIVAPTGSGKTVVGADIIRSATEKGSKTLFVAHRKELIDQSYEKLNRFGVKCGVIMSNDPRSDSYYSTQVASIQTLARRMDRLPPANLVIFDECHHALSETWTKLRKMYPNAILLGLTATPWRLDKRGLLEVFEDSILTATPRQLIDQGYLVEYDAFAYDAPDLHEIKITAGDYNQSQLGIACNTGVLVGSVVREYIAHANGRRTILFPVNISHSKHLVEEFRLAGISAAHLDCDTPKKERESIIEGLSSGRILVVSSVGVLTEGFDSPGAEVCIVARPTKSVSLHLQMIGRVLRPSPETGKNRALIHDHAGNMLRHGLPDEDRDYSLRSTPDHITALFTCPLCFQIFSRIKPNGHCPKCDGLIAEPRDLTATGERRIDKREIPGERINAEQIRKIRAQREALGLRTDLTDQQLHKIRHATRDDKVREYLRLLSVANRKSFKKGFIAHQFRQCFGHWPKFTDDELRNASASSFPFVPLTKVTH